MITVFFTKSNTINRSYSVVYDELIRRALSDVRMVDVATASIPQILEFARSSDLVVIDNFIRVAEGLDPSKFDSTVLDNWRGAAFYNEAWQAVVGSGARILFVASGWDLHWPGPILEELLPRIHSIAWLYEKRPLMLSDVASPYRDEWMTGHTDPIANWNAVRKLVPIRIELIHSLAADEFTRGAPKQLWDACIAGATYSTRQIALGAARREGLRLAPFRWADNTILINTERLARLSGAATASRLRNRLRNSNQRFFVERSRASFVCGSGYCYPVRKFFEVPAQRSLLIAYPCFGFSDYGFADGVNCVVTAPEDFGATARRMLAKPELCEKLRNSAWAMVRRLHSVESRVDNLVECMRRLASDRLKGAEFVDGEFVVS